MILKGSQRGSPGSLATHLLNIADNDHVTVYELRGFVSGGLPGAMAEVDAIAKGTRCQQPAFSLSLNPPKEAFVEPDYFVKAAERAESTLGLQGQPRAIVIHEKEGRCHAHVVWSRIDAEQMKAVNLPFFKERLNTLSKELYLENEWTLPEGLKSKGRANPLNFTLAEWQQAKRHGVDPREVKQVFQEAWSRSDNLASFRNALEEQGFFLAKGDQRGLVAFDLEQRVFSVSRFSGVKPKELKNRFGDIGKLPTLNEAKADLQKRLRGHYLRELGKMKTRHADELKPLEAERKRLVEKQRRERVLLVKQQAIRTRAETLERSARFRKGLATVLDLLTGRLFTLRKQNSAEALACANRDKLERRQCAEGQRDERAGLQRRLASRRQLHADERREARLTIADTLAATSRERTKARDKSNELSLKKELKP